MQRMLVVASRIVEVFMVNPKNPKKNGLPKELHLEKNEYDSEFHLGSTLLLLEAGYLLP